MESTEKYMDYCLTLAIKGFGHVAPNPMVGCVIVHENKIIGEGYHQHYGQAHAEVNAINSVQNKALLKTASLYVTLEPCVHFGKTPPCTDLILYHQIPTIIVGAIDPYAAVAGKGIAKLREAGCMVQLGVMAKACEAINKRFFTFHNRKRPYIILKWAQTQDKFIDHKRATTATTPLSISNEEAKRLSHQWRAEEQSILVGTNTAVLDNPQLTVRSNNGSNPLRIAIDKNLRTPGFYHLLDGTTPTLIFTGKKKQPMPNVEYVTIDFDGNVIAQVLQELFKRNIQSLIVEGGAKLLQSFINNNSWDEARIFTAPIKIAAGVKAPLLNGKAASEHFLGDNQLTVIANLDNPFF